MSEQLHGRALDEACARAMGWTFITYPDGPCPDVKHWKSPVWDKPSDIHWRPCRPFSDCAETLPEMLAWLTDRIGFVRIDVSKNNVTVADDESLLCFGPTLNEAVARLVVAVAADAPRGPGHAGEGVGR